MIISRGKYIFFMDADDILVKTGLEAMYTNAEKFQADVVRYTKSYQSSGIGKKFWSDKYLVTNADIKQPVFVSEDLSVRLDAYTHGVFPSPPWYNLVRRDFLTYNEIKFDDMPRDDDLWTFKLMCLAKKYLLIPDVCYLKRNDTGDNRTTKKRTVNKYINYWFGRSVMGFKILDEFTAKIEAFKNNPELRYAALNLWLNTDLNFALKACVEANLSLSVMYDMFKTEFKEYFGEQNALMSALITNNITAMYNLMIAHQKITELTSQEKN